MNKTFKVNYLARDFQSIKNELKAYAKRYYGDQFSDLSEASINTFMIDAVSYVGDILSYYTDYQANESFLPTAVESKNILNLAKSLGYKEKKSSTTAGKIAIYMLIPSTVNNTPDYGAVPVIKKGTIVRTADGTRKYLINEDVIVDENLIGTNYVVARTNVVGNPTFYAVKFYAPVISGTIVTVNVAVDSFVKFNKISLNDFNAVEIISVTDSEGNEYYEVPNLTQNVVYRSVLNKDSMNSSARYALKTISAQRRFIFDYEEGNPILVFGGKQYKPDEDLTINPITEPSKFILNRYNNDFLEDAYFEPNKLLNGDSYGVGPENTTLAITYRKNEAQNNNAATGEVTNLENLLYEFRTTLPQDTINTVLQSVQVLNEEPIVGSGDNLSIDEIKDLAGMIYQSQNRAVTAKDYETLCYMMPVKYGAIKRVKAERDPRSLKNNINLYVICVDNFGSLTAANTTVKENLKEWLSGYKMITDTVDIIDAKIVNLGINYTILVDPNLDKIAVNNLVLAQLRFIYANKPQIGESFNILDVYREIQKIDGVLDVKEVTVRNITDVSYSQISFNIEQNTTQDGNMIIMPRNAVYEIKDVNLDITGKVV